MSERWLSLAEIATYLGVSKDSIYRWVEIGKMPAHKVGRQWKFKATEVDAWVRDGKAQIDSAPAIAVTRSAEPRRASSPRKEKPVA